MVAIPHSDAVNELRVGRPHYLCPVAVWRRVMSLWGNHAAIGIVSSLSAVRAVETRNPV